MLLIGVYTSFLLHGLQIRMEGCTYALHGSILACRKGCVVLWSDYCWLLPCAWWDVILHSTSEGLQHTKDGAQARAYAQSQTNLDEYPAFQNMSWSNKRHNSPHYNTCISLGRHAYLWPSWKGMFNFITTHAACM
jgi:hypothetical protein